MTDMETEVLASVPEHLVHLLEQHLLAVDIEVFWERKDALGRMLPTLRSDPAQTAAARVEAAGKVPPELLDAVIANLDGPEPMPSTLSEVLEDWERLRVDHEKLVGHLLLIHREPVEATMAKDYLTLEDHHRDLHIAAVAERSPGGA